MTEGISIEGAFLCDYANATNGLLNVFGGAINTLNRPFFPAPINAYLVCMVGITSEYDGDAVRMSVVIKSSENEDIYARLDAQTVFGVVPNGDVPAQVPLVIDIKEVVLPRLGRFAMSITIGTHSRMLEFQIRTPPEGAANTSLPDIDLSAVAEHFKSQPPQ